MHNLCCGKCIEPTYQLVSRLSILSFLAKYWVSWQSLDDKRMWRRAMKTALNLSFRAVPADSKSRCVSPRCCLMGSRSWGSLQLAVWSSDGRLWLGADAYLRGVAWWVHVVEDRYSLRFGRPMDVCGWEQMLSANRPSVIGSRVTILPIPRERKRSDGLKIAKDSPLRHCVVLVWYPRHIGEGWYGAGAGVTWTGSRGGASPYPSPADEQRH